MHGRNLFLFLGNTLGNELNEQAVLKSIAQAMQPNDLIMIELQLKEQNPLPVDEISKIFQTNLQFYAGPLLALGCQETNLEIQALADLHSRPNSWTYFCECKIPTAVTRYISPIARTLIFGGEGTTINTYVIRKFAEDAIEPLLREAD